MSSSTHDSLTKEDAKFWEPQKEILEYIESKIPERGMVLDVGAGRAPFARANVHLDITWHEAIPKERFVQCDILQEQLPFEDKKFDFVYCRHTIEDLFNPFPVLSEMSRVGRAGYIETPSPIAELCRNIDGGGAIPWRGYNHHHWLIWSVGSELRFLPKFPMMEHFSIAADAGPADVLRDDGKYWNTSYLWEGSISWKYLRLGADYKMPEGYPDIVMQAIREAAISIDDFYNNMEKAGNAK